MDKLKELFEIRNAIRTFLEEKLQADVHSAGISITDPAEADMSFKLDDINYLLTIKEENE
tara:strand:+ start:164 stop:343 length:180 start_codon:yes stop_codon:yes gene_type:complete